MAVTLNPFFSKYGFKGPGFTVDADGNVSVKSLSSETPIEDIIQQVSDTLTTVEIAIGESNGNFTVDGTDGNPDITLTKGRTYRFNLDLTSISFNIRDENDNLVTADIQHVKDGTVSTGNLAHNKQDGYVEWVVPATASGYYYADVANAIRGDFVFVDPEITGIGSFTSLLVTGTSEFRDDLAVNANISQSGQLTLTNTTQSTSPTTGSLITAGGVGIAKDLFVGGNVIAKSFKIDSAGEPTLESQSNLEFKAGNAVVFTVNDIEQGRITSSGSNLPVVNTSIENTRIGAGKPSTGKFTELLMSENITRSSDPQSVTTREYVDSADIVYSIVFGA